MKKYLTILALISSLIADNPNDFDEITSEDIPKILSIIQESTKEDLPIVLDDYTTLFDVFVIQNIIEYKNQINSEDENLKKLLETDKEALIKSTFENNKNYLCGDEETRVLLKKGAIFVYDFYDFYNTQLFRFSVQEKDCQ